MKDILKLAGTNIRRVRKAKGLTLEEAAGTELNATYLGRVERGEENISLKNLAKVAKALDTEVYELLIPSAPTEITQRLTALVRSIEPSLQPLFLKLLSEVNDWQKAPLAKAPQKKKKP